MLTRITFITAAGLLTLAALTAGSTRKAAYDAAETAYFECLQDLPRAECLPLLTSSN